MVVTLEIQHTLTLTALSECQGLLGCLFLNTVPGMSSSLLNLIIHLFERCCSISGNNMCAENKSLLLL